MIWIPIGIVVFTTWIALILVFRGRRQVRLTDAELAMRRLSVGIAEINTVMGEVLLPTIRRLAEQMREFNKALAAAPPNE